MNIESVFSILSLVGPSINTAEDFIRGVGRGVEKREAVLGDLARKILELRKEVAALKEVNIKRYKWVKFALESPELLNKVGKIVDDIVDLANWLETFEGEDPLKPVVPEVVN